ncbi:uncharacterized protein LOC143037520 isoform X2 [Oratosquilla oratoria]|uniref:uncharacterized protein LOC143037520 isoform X2 n=1 Tax=Oratosquilla oratoria TaxID=337810 RepID=UPI003F76A63B
MAPGSRVARSDVSSPPCNSDISSFPSPSTSLPSSVTAEGGSQCCQRRQRTEMTSQSSTTYSNSFKTSRRISDEESYPEEQHLTTSGGVSFEKSEENSRTMYEDISNSALKTVSNSERQSRSEGLELLKQNFAASEDSKDDSKGKGKTYKCEWASGETPGKIRLEKVEALRRDIEFAHDRDYVKEVYQEVEASESQESLAESESNVSGERRVTKGELESSEVRDKVSESSDDLWDPHGSTGSVVKISASAESQRDMNSEEYEDEDSRCTSALTEEESEGVFLTFDRIPIQDDGGREEESEFVADEQPTFDEDFRRMVLKESGKVTVEDYPEECLQDFEKRGVYKNLSCILEEETPANSNSSAEASTDQSTESTEEESVTYVAEAVLGRVNDTKGYESNTSIPGNVKEYIAEEVLGKVNNTSGYDLNVSISGNLKESLLENTQDTMNINLLESYMSDIIDIYMKKLEGQMTKNLENVKTEYLEEELTETTEDLDAYDIDGILVIVIEKIVTEDADCKAVENRLDMREPIFESPERSPSESWANDSVRSSLDESETRSSRYLKDDDTLGSSAPSQSNSWSSMVEKEEESGRSLSRSTSKKENLFHSQEVHGVRNTNSTSQPISPTEKRERVIEIEFDNEPDVSERGSSRISILEGGSSTSSFPDGFSCASSVLGGSSSTSSVTEGNSLIEGGSSTSSINKEFDHKENITRRRNSSKDSYHMDVDMEASSNIKPEASAGSKVHKIRRETTQESSSDQSGSLKAYSEPAVIRDDPYGRYEEAVFSEDERHYKVILSVEEFKDGEVFLKAVGRHFMVEGRRLEKENGKTVMYTFHRRLTMPKLIDPQKVTANLSKDGILCLMVPKRVSTYDDRPYRTGVNRRDDFMRSHSLDEETRNWRTLASSFFDDPFFDYPESSLQSKIESFFNKDPFGHDYRRKFRSLDDRIKEKRGRLSRKLDEMKSSSISDRKKNLSSTKEDDHIYKIKVDLNGYGGQRCVNAVEGGLMVEADGKSGFGSRLRDPKFRKYFPVPECYNTKKAQAVLSRNGILTISVPIYEKAEAGASYVDTKTKLSEERRRHSFSSAEGSSAEAHSREAGIIFSAPSPCPEASRQDSFGRDIRKSLRRTSERVRKESGNFSEGEQTTITSLRDSKSGEGLALTVVPTDNEIQMLLNVKDFKDGDLSVKTVGQTVVVEGRIEKKEDDSSVYTFRREFFLPRGMDMSSVTSSISPEGILTVTAQRKTEHRHSWHARGSFDVL